MALFKKIIRVQNERAIVIIKNRIYQVWRTKAIKMYRESICKTSQNSINMGRKLVNRQQPKNIFIILETFFARKCKIN